MPAGLCVPDQGGGPGWGAGTLSKVRDKKRWWQWPEEGPDTDWTRGIRKGGLRRGRSRGGRWREAPRPQGRGQGLCPAQTLAEAPWAAPPSWASTAPNPPADELQGRTGKAPQKGADRRSPPCAGRSGVQMLSRAGRASPGRRARVRTERTEGTEGAAHRERDPRNAVAQGARAPGAGVREGPRWRAGPVCGAALCRLLLSPPANWLESPAESGA